MLKSKKSELVIYPFFRNIKKESGAFLIFFRKNASQPLSQRAFTERETADERKDTEEQKNWERVEERSEHRRWQRCGTRTPLFFL